MVDARTVRPQDHAAREGARLRTSARGRAVVAGIVLPLALLALGACAEQGDSIEELTSGDPVATAPVDAAAGKAKDKRKDRDKHDESDPDAKDGDGLWAGEVGDKVPPGQLGKLLKAGVAASTTARFSMSSGGGLSQFSGEGEIDYTTDPPSSAMTMTVGGGANPTQQIEVRMVDGTVYMKLPGAGGGKFLAFDLKDPKNPFGQDFVAQTDPSRQVEVLTRGMRKAVYQGSEDGLDQFRVTVAAKQVARSLGTGPAAAVPGTMTYDLWLDEKHRMRRVVVDMGGGLGGFEMQIDGYGEDVDIRKPAPGQIMQAPPGATS